MSPIALPSSKNLEDPLSYLPCSSVLGFRKGQIIYSREKPSTSIYLVIDGKVKVSRVADGGREIVIDICREDDFFGESALLGVPQSNEICVALGITRIMIWSTFQIEALAEERPGLAIGLLQLQVQRSADFVNRIQSFSLDGIARRLARALIRFSERLGSPGDDGSLRMIPLTHQLLGQYVGTSREIVTQYMNLFRCEGYLSYSRKEILLYGDKLKEWLKQEAPSVSPDEGSARARRTTSGVSPRRLSGVGRPLWA